jgi:lipopolysaccharide/colanic/teichoic acid biosynthesis glycosyltransferase
MRGLEQVLKRLVDLTASTLGLLLLAPAMLLIALLVRLGSPGPVLSRESRRGYRGRLFEILRFRTTVGDAEQHSGYGDPDNPSAYGRLAHGHNSPRVTPLGRFLRRYRLDELPQLIQVLRGEMSLVGPRPLSIVDSDRLRELDQQGYERRLTVMPGASGAWQVARQRDWNYTQMIKLDVDYIENWSPRRDLWIIAKTITALLLRRRAD